jgi:hypothetical protein
MKRYNKKLLNKIKAKLLRALWRLPQSLYQPKAAAVSAVLMSNLQYPRKKLRQH